MVQAALTSKNIYYFFASASQDHIVMSIGLLIGNPLHGPHFLSSVFIEWCYNHLWAQIYVYLMPANPIIWKRISSYAKYWKYSVIALNYNFNIFFVPARLTLWKHNLGFLFFTLVGNIFTGIFTLGYLLSNCLAFLNLETNLWSLTFWKHIIFLIHNTRFSLITELVSSAIKNTFTTLFFYSVAVLKIRIKYVLGNSQFL